MPFWAGIVLDTLDQRPASMAARHARHLLRPGRAVVASSAGRSRAPALVVGHPTDPIHPFADAAMLAEEMPNAQFVEAHSVLEWRARPERLDRDGGRVRARLLGRRPRDAAPDAARPRLRGALGRMAGASLPRRGGRAAHPQAGRGRPHHHPADPPARAGAGGGEGRAQTTSRLGSRLEPFTHVDLQLAEGRTSTSITQAETLEPFAPGWAATTSATPPAP